MEICFRWIRTQRWHFLIFTISTLTVTYLLATRTDIQRQLVKHRRLHERKASVSLYYTLLNETGQAEAQTHGHWNETGHASSHTLDVMHNASVLSKEFREIKNGTVSERVALLEKILGKNVYNGNNCRKVLPQALIVGVMKSGTETLATFLAIHPEIAMQMELPTMLFFNTHYAKGYDWYKNQMPCSSEGQLTIEKSPQYFQAARVPERIRTMNSSIKLIVIVREPIQRSISHYSHVVEKKPSRYLYSFEKTITNNRGGIDRKHKTVIRSLYSIQLKRWLKYFKMEQIHIVNGDNFKINPSEELNKIEEFLGIRRYFTPELFIYNSDKGFFCLNVSGETDGCMWAGKGRQHPEISPHLIDRLRHFFKRYNEMFFDIIGQRFDWEYQTSV